MEILTKRFNDAIAMGWAGNLTIIHRDEKGETIVKGEDLTAILKPLIVANSIEVNEISGEITPLKDSGWEMLEILDLYFVANRKQTKTLRFDINTEDAVYSNSLFKGWLPKGCPGYPVDLGKRRARTLVKSWGTQRHGILD